MGAAMSLHVARLCALTSVALVSLWWLGDGGMVLAQTPESLPPPAAEPGAPGTLPTITVETTKKKQAPKPAARRPTPARTAPVAPESEQTRVVRQTQTQVTTFNTARSNIYTEAGANQSAISKDDIQKLPQGENQPVEKVLLQLPGVTQDSAASGNLHVRNEHANVAYRINGILLPDGVSGFGSVLETSLIGNLALLTGVLPPQFGLRTAAVVDINTRDGAFENGGKVGVYGGSHDTFTTALEYGGIIGGDCTSQPIMGGRFVKASPAVPGSCGPVTEYFFTGRYYTSNLGIENPLPDPEAIHDRTTQERGFGYVSTILDPTTRISWIGGASLGRFQIPNVPGATAFPGLTSAFGVANFDSTKLDENQQERTYYNVLAYQKSVNDLDFQLSYFNRYSSLHFVPDVIGDLFINGIASDVYRATFANGVAGDGSYKINDAHTVRAGFSVTAESTQNTNLSTVEPCATIDCVDFVDAPFTVTDAISKLGWLYAFYASDEWRVTNQFTIIGGLRFDQMDEYVSANQMSPRVNFIYTPLSGTTLHAGYARYFTPPQQTIAAPVNLALFQNPANITPANPFGGTNSGAPGNSGEDPVLPERASVYDAGITQVFSRGCTPAPSGYFTKAKPVNEECEALKLGLDAYYKNARDLLDDGQFGAALVLSGFNYETAYNEGVEFSLNYRNGPFQAYGNIAWAIQKGKNIISNQFLIDNTVPLDDLGGLTRFQYIQTHYIFTDHTQVWTGSAGVSYLRWDTLFTADMIFGSGLRQGDANIDHLPAYTQVNVGVSHEFKGLTAKPFTLRFDVVNVFDEVYEIRSGTGIGVFAPQFGPRRGFFGGWSQQL
jgi:outer membrane receptor protein involved in Fe transport